MPSSAPHTLGRTGTGTGDKYPLQNEYIKNLQHQIYLLEMEVEYLYPRLTFLLLYTFALLLLLLLLSTFAL